MKISWKDLIFANIDGYNAITMAVVAGLAIIDGALIIDRIVQYIVSMATGTPVAF